MPLKTDELMQYHVREPMYDPDPEFVHGYVGADSSVRLTWNSRSGDADGDADGDGRVYIDGSEVADCLDIGDEVRLCPTGAPRLLLYDKIDPP